MKQFSIRSLSLNFAFIIASLICPSAHASKAPVLFQLNNVLIKTGVFDAAKMVGISALGNPFHLQTRFLEFLNWVAPQPHSAYMACDESGKPLSLAMYDWFKGTATNQMIHSRLMDAIKRDPGFLGWLERGAITKIVDLTFTPTKFIETRKLVNGAVELVRELKQRGHKVYVFANWDKESFQLLKAKFLELFNLFDGIVISGDTTMVVKAIKPDPSIYEYFVNKFGITTTPILIDSQMENIATANRLGWKTIHCVDDLKAARETLNRII